MPTLHLPAFTPRRALAALALASLAPAASAQLLQSWNFNDAAATTLTGVANSGPGSAAWSADITGVSTNGTGALSINSTTTSNSFAALGATFDTGIVSATATFADWNLLNEGGLNQSFYFGFTNAASASASLVARVALLARGETGVELLVQQSSITNTPAIFLPVDLLGPLSITLTVDTGGDTLDLSYTYGGDTFSVYTGATLDTNSSLRSISHLTLRTLGNISTSTLLLGSLTVSQVPEPATAATAAGLAALGLGLLRRRRSTR